MSVYRRIIQRGRFCDTCLLPLYREESVTDRWPDAAAPMRYPGAHSERTSTSIGQPVTQPPPRACDGCGEIDGGSGRSSETLSKRGIRGLARNASEALDFAGIPHDAAVLEATAARLKSEPGSAGCDDDILAAAVGHAVFAGAAEEAILGCFGRR